MNFNMPNRSNFLITIIMVIPTYFLLQAMFGRMIISALLSGLFAGAVNHVRRIYTKTLEYRIASKPTKTYDVKMNNIYAGIISDADYAQIQLATINDVRVYLSQLSNVGRVFLNVLNHLFIAIPVFTFWAILILSVYAPSELVEVINKVKSPSDILSIVQHIFQLLIPLLAMTYTVMLAARMNLFGFVNEFSFAINKAIREKLEIATLGDIDLIAQQYSLFAKHGIPAV